MERQINNIILNVSRTHYVDQKEFLKAKATEHRRMMFSFLAKATNVAGFVLGNFKTIPNYISPVINTVSFTFEQCNTHLAIKEHKDTINALELSINRIKSDIITLEQGSNLQNHIEVSMVEGDWNPKIPSFSRIGTEPGFLTPAALISYGSLAVQTLATILTTLDNDTDGNVSFNYGAFIAQSAAIAIPLIAEHYYKMHQQDKLECYNQRFACTKTIKLMKMNH